MEFWEISGKEYAIILDFWVYSNKSNLIGDTMLKRQTGTLFLIAGLILTIVSTVGEI